MSGRVSSSGWRGSAYKQKRRHRRDSVESFLTLPPCRDVPLFQRLTVSTDLHAQHVHNTRQARTVSSSGWK
jgi:hypothetical protein